jgi:hypothetical protein
VLVLTVPIENSAMTIFLSKRWSLQRELMLLALGIVCWSATARAEALPDQTRDYIRVCARAPYGQTFTAKDGKPTSCAQDIWLKGGDIVMVRTSPECKVLREALALSAGEVADRIFDWVRANKGNSNNPIATDIAAAFSAVYRCD